MSEPQTEAGRALVAALTLYKMQVGSEWVPADPTAALDFVQRIEAEAAAAERERVLGEVEDHQPSIGVDTDDSTWLECSCGWDQTAKPFVAWTEHVIAALRAKPPERNEP